MLRLTARMPDRGFDVHLHVARGETVAILGPNGAGKSTLLGILAGLVRPDSGHAALADRVLFDLPHEGPRDGGGRPVWVPPHDRGVALLAQEALLFPHLSAVTNVAFGPRSSGASRQQAHARALRWLAEVEASDLGARRPAQLSGGQAQRVAVARALAADPQLLLLDEPLSALDVAAAPVLRRMLRRVLAERTVLLVTHDVLDALTLADRVVVMNAGRIIEQGPTREVLERPRNRFTADLAALNLITGTLTLDGMKTDAGGHLPAPATDIRVGTRIGLAVRPANVTVSLEAPMGGDRIVFPGRVHDVEPRGDLVRVRSEEVFSDLTPQVVADLDLEPGTAVHFSAAVADTVIYPL